MEPCKNDHVSINTRLLRSLNIYNLFAEIYRLAFTTRPPVLKAISLGVLL